MQKNISVTNHAVERYALRCLECGVPAHCMEMIREELQMAVCTSGLDVLGDGRYPIKHYPEHVAVIVDNIIVTVRER